jgi:hypothetical protein
MRIDCDFPGGNSVIETIDGDDVRLHQDLRDTAHAWFYWAFRVREAQGRRLTFTFTQSRALGVRGPACSRDGGATWHWLGAGAVQANAFTCTIPGDAPEVRFSFGMPYPLDRWTRFAAGQTGRAGFTAQTLCLSRRGRPVPCARVGDPAVDPAHRVVLSCRHHCCEMMAWLRRHVHFLVVPFADLDGVEAGDQGKDRRPRDHGRDYEGESLYAETAALRSLLPEWSQGRLRAVIDLHCPWIAGTRNETVYLVGSQASAQEQEQRRFSAILAAACQGPIPVSAADFLPFGTDWNTAANYGGGKTFSTWAREQLGVQLGTSIELPYANAGGAEVNADSARLFGHDLGRALGVYLQSLSPQN